MENSKQKEDELDKALKEFLGLPWDKGEKPYFVNPEGYEWYIDKEITDWAQKEDVHGIKLPNVIGFFVKKNNFIERVLMDKETNEIIYSNTSLEAVAYHIDMLKVLKRYDG